MTYRTLIINAIKNWFFDLYDRVINKKRYYMFVGVGIPPKNFKEVFEQVISEDKVNVMFTFELTLVRFKSDKSLKELHNIFKNNFDLDTYFLSKDDKNFKHYCASEFFEYLRMPHQKYSLIHAQNTVDEINFAIDQAKQMTEDHLSDEFDANDNVFMNQKQEEKTINDILDKVSKEGIESLTKEEKEKLDEYRNNQ